MNKAKKQILIESLVLRVRELEREQERAAYTNELELEQFTFLADIVESKISHQLLREKIVSDSELSDKSKSDLIDYFQSGIGDSEGAAR